MNARLAFILRDVFYTRLSNSQQFPRLFEDYSVDKQQLTDRDLQLLLESEQDHIGDIHLYNIGSILT